MGQLVSSQISVHQAGWSSHVSLAFDAYDSVIKMGFFVVVVEDSLITDKCFCTHGGGLHFYLNM